MKNCLFDMRIWKLIIAIASFGLVAVIIITQIWGIDIHLSHLAVSLDQGGFWCFTDSANSWSLKFVNYMTPYSFMASFPLPEFGPFWFALPWWILLLIWSGSVSLIWWCMNHFAAQKHPRGFEPLFISRK
jgi:uncharacterized membrane protein